MANPFLVGDKVRTDFPQNSTSDRKGGTVKHIACYLATSAGGKSCNNKSCMHATRDYVWVSWPSGLGGSVLYSYHYNELIIDVNAQNTTSPTTKGSIISTPKSPYPSPINTPTPSDNSPDASSEIVSETLKHFKSKVSDIVLSKPAPDSSEIRPLEDHEIDWQAYHGFTRRKGGSYRKI